MIGRRFLSALLLSGTAFAAVAETDDHSQCLVFWATQCYQIHDARTRDITHHMLITRGPIGFSAGDAGCEAGLDQRLDAEEQAALLEDFNDILEDIDGCQTLETLPLELFEDADAALARYRRHTREHSRTRIHELHPPGLREHR